jgi:hypothetical protein
LYLDKELRLQCRTNGGQPFLALRLAEVQKLMGVMSVPMKCPVPEEFSSNHALQARSQAQWQSLQKTQQFSIWRVAFAMGV